MNELQLFRLLLSMDVGAYLLPFLTGDSVLKTLYEMYYDSSGQGFISLSPTVHCSLSRRIKEFTSLRVCMIMYARRALYAKYLKHRAYAFTNTMRGWPRTEKRCFSNWWYRMNDFGDTNFFIHEVELDELMMSSLVYGDIRRVKPSFVIQMLGSDFNLPGFNINRFQLPPISMMF